MRFIVSSFVFFQASSNSEQTSSVCVSNSLVSILHIQTSTTFEQQKPINLLQVKTPALGCLSNHYNQFHLFLFIALLQQTLVEVKMFVGATRKKKLPSVHSVLALSGHTNKIEKMHTFDLLQNLPGKRESRVNNILFGIFLLGFRVL